MRKQLNRALERGYNQNRLAQTLPAPTQSATFFSTWRTAGLWAALRWWHDFKRDKQHLSRSWLRVGCDGLGSLLVASGLARCQLLLPIVLVLVVSLGGTSTPPIPGLEEKLES